MKRLLLWLIGVALGVVVLLAAVLGVSYSFTSEGAKPCLLYTSDAADDA